MDSTKTSVDVDMPDLTKKPSISSLATSGVATPTSEEVSASFRESKICIAVDTSGSTYGPALRAEKLAIRSVCDLIPRSKDENITIIPWNHTSYPPRPLSQLDTLESGGGTDPNVVLQSTRCRLFLQNSGFWFLMTDGVIDEHLVRKFARNITQYGMHGKACIIAVFGDRIMKPSDCNISVGLAAFAVSPHVAFLYTDIRTNKTFLLSTKGCFSNLLPPNKKNPKLDYNTTWDDLPQVSYEDLTRVSVPMAQELKRDEIALQGGARVSIPELLGQETVDEELMRQIMLNEDNIKSVALTAQLRGESDKLGKWLDKVDEKLSKEEDEEEYDIVDNRDSQLLKDFEAKLAGPVNPLTHALDRREGTAKPLRPAYEMSAGILPASYMNAVQMRQSSSSMMRQSSSMMRAISNNSSLDDPRTSLSSIDHLDRQHYSPPQSHVVQGWPLQGPGYYGQGSAAQSYPLDAVPHYNDLNLAISGFTRPTLEKDQFTGDCTTCQKSRTVLALILRAPPQSTETKDFPPVGSTSKLNYPLTMGNYAEMDIIADTIVCDTCAAALAKSGTTRQNEAVKAVLPLVSYTKNQDAWLQTLNIATGRRFHRADLPLVFLGILYTKIERLVANPLELSSLQNALRWEANLLQSEVVLQTDKLLGNQFGAGLVHEVLLRNFRDSLSPEKFPLLLSYPLDGFIVANAALSNSPRRRMLSQEKRKAIVLLRFLYHLLENYRAYAQDNGVVQLHAAKTLILLMDDAHGPRSLFKWASLRQFSFGFDKVEDLRKYLAESIALNRYKLSFTAADLQQDTPLLGATGLADFRRLGPLFSWIESEAAHAIAVFVHYMMRLDVGECTADAQFRKLRERPEVKEALADPGALSAKSVERFIKPLPALE
ncbi:hypothetical protein GGS26DRAFT_464361 [Hypomontagnella submonticulosa]|nr:hypothetical protein GGS26DRAFT_464361 [Hypomontagnella submonticulosa]